MKINYIAGMKDIDFMEGNEEVYIDYDFYQDLVFDLSERILKTSKKLRKVFGIPKNGSIIAETLTKYGFEVTTHIKKADVIVDDIYETGKTYKLYSKYKKPFYVLVKKKPTEKWIKWWFEKPDVK